MTVASSDRAASSERHLKLRRAVALGDQPGNPRPHFVELLAHHLQAGPRLGGVEPQQQIARGHPLAIVNRDLRHHPAGRMLNGLDVRLNDKVAGNDDGARDRHQHGQPTGHEDEGEQHPKPHPQFVLVGAPGARRHVAGLIVVVREAVAVDEEGDARRQTDAAGLHQLSDRR